MYSAKLILKSSLLGTVLFYFILLTFIILIWLKPIPKSPRFVLENLGNQTIHASDRIFESFIIPKPSFLVAAHSATLDILPNGNLMAMWFAGSHEGKPDVKIWQSEFNNESWSMSNPVISPEILSLDAKRFIKKVGNPVVYKASNGVWHLFVVSVSIGGWSGSSLNHFISNNDGQTWSFKEKLILSPFFNLSNLDRTSPISLTDGGFYLPIYHEFIHTYPELIRFDQNGDFIQQIRMTSKIHLLQPSIVAASENQGYAFLRNSGQVDKILYMQKSNNAGLSWSVPEATNLENYDSSIATANLGDDGLLMVHNPQNRNKLVLSISNDAKSWRQIYVLESTQLGEYSYPAIKIHGDIVDILYTWNRQAIKHIRFNKLWLDSKLRRNAKSWGI